MSFANICFDGTCRCCGNKKKVVSTCSAICAFTYSICEDCLQRGIEPYDIMADCLASSDLHYPNDVSDGYRVYIKNSLQELGISEEQFAADVEKAIKEE